MERLKQIRNLKQKTWVRLVFYVIILIAVSVGLALLLRRIMPSPADVQKFASAAYLLVFVITLACNASVLVPVTYPHLAVMIPVAKMMTEVSPWGFVFVALVASVAGALGEITGYYAGYLGKRIVHLENTPGYERLTNWMKKYGPWGIFIIALQPILPVDVAGLLAGASKLPLWRFLLPCWAGKLGKYLLACYVGERVLHFLSLSPFWPS
jgi:membrane protein YqaA with SNARE-associated domain